MSNDNTKIASAFGAITALNQSVVLDVARADGGVIWITATSVTATFTVEGSFDSTDGVNGTWFTMAASPSNSTNLYTQVTSIVLTAAPTIFWTFRALGLSKVRAKATSFTAAAALTVNMAAHRSEV